MNEVDQDLESFRAYGRAIQAWAMELSRRLDPEKAGKLMIAGAIPVLTTVYGNGGCADFLRELARTIEAAENTPVWN